MDESSTVTGPPVDKPITEQFWELPIRPYLVELSLSLPTEEVRSLYRLSIEAPTLKAAIGICQQVSARFFDIASRETSSGE